MEGARERREDEGPGWAKLSKRRGFAVGRRVGMRRLALEARGVEWPSSSIRVRRGGERACVGGRRLLFPQHLPSFPHPRYLDTLRTQQARIHSTPLHATAHHRDQTELPPALHATTLSSRPLLLFRDGQPVRGRAARYASSSYIVNPR